MYNRFLVVDVVSEFLDLPKSFYKSTVEVEFNCPKCDDHRNKFNLVINLDKLVFQCWACEYRGTINKLVYDYGDQEQLKKIKSVRGTKSLAGDKKIFSETPTFSQDFFSNSFRTMKVDWKDSLHFRAAKRYLNQRKITKKIIDKWDICYAEDGSYCGRIIIPSKSINGKVEYFVARDIYGVDKIKYKNPPIEKGSIIFGEKFVDWKKPVILTEGVFDAIILYNAVPLLGTKIRGHKKLTKKILDNKTPIIIGFDEDEIGKKERINVAKFLKNLGVNLYIIGENKYNDLSSAYQNEGKDYLIKLIRDSQPFDELDLAISMLEE
jgi:DNA primase